MGEDINVQTFTKKKNHISMLDLKKFQWQVEAKDKRYKTYVQKKNDKRN